MMILSKAITNTIRRPAARERAVDEEPGCVYGLVTRKGLEDLARDFERLESKINGLIFGVIVTVLLQAWKVLG